MMGMLTARARAFWKDSSGQALPVIALIMVMLTAMVGLVVDMGSVYLCHRELQASSDAAALAGAALVPTASSATAVSAAATAASSVSGGTNAYNNLGSVTMVSGYPKLKCLSTLQTQGISCVGPLQYNAVQVVQQAVVPLYFARVIGKRTMTIQASATAAKGGGSSRPYNIALLLDTTLSMNFQDANCGDTQMNCTLNGARQLLTLLDPCGTSQTSCTIVGGQSANSVVRVSVFTFPQVTSSTVNQDSNCSGGTATATAYGFPTPGAPNYSPGSTTYQITPFQSDYRLSDTSTTLNSNSALAIAMGGVSGCSSMGPPSNAGIYGTYYAATIYAAQSALMYEQGLFPDSQNVMIIIGDGDATAPRTNGPYTVMPSPANATGLYPSYYGECGQAVTAANFATAQGTRVYSVAYGSPPTGCQYDQTGNNHSAGAYPNITPCNEMAQLASASYYFFSDFQQSGSGSTCVAAQAVTALSDIFLQIAGDLTVARLVSDSTT